MPFLLSRLCKRWWTSSRQHDSPRASKCWLDEESLHVLDQGARWKLSPSSGRCNSHCSVPKPGNKGSVVQIQGKSERGQLQIYLWVLLSDDEAQARWNYKGYFQNPIFGSGQMMRLVIAEMLRLIGIVFEAILQIMIGNLRYLKYWLMIH